MVLKRKKSAKKGSMSSLQKLGKEFGLTISPDSVSRRGKSSSGLRYSDGGTPIGIPIGIPIGTKLSRRASSSKSLGVKSKKHHSSKGGTRHKSLKKLHRKRKTRRSRRTRTRTRKRC